MTASCLTEGKDNQPVALKGHCVTEVSDQDILYYLRGTEINQH